VPTLKFSVRFQNKSAISARFFRRMAFLDLLAREDDNSNLLLMKYIPVIHQFQQKVVCYRYLVYFATCFGQPGPRQIIESIYEIIVKKLQI